MPKGDLTRERIVQLSCPVFNKKGYAGASMSDILAATGLQKGGIYNHFESKEELALAVFDYGFSLVQERWTAACTARRDAPSRMLAVVDMFDSYVREPFIEGGCPMFNTAIESDDTNPALSARARQAIAICLSSIEGVIEKGIERGELRAGLNAANAAAVLLSALEGALVLSRLFNDAKHLRATQAQMREWIETLRP